MASYNLMKATDRRRLYDDRRSERDAVDSGVWPRDLNDYMRWISHAGDPAYARRMCQNEMDALTQIETRITQHDPDLQGWEP